MIPGGRARAGRHRAPRIGRQDSRGPAPRRREEPAHRRGGAHRRVGAGRQDHRRRLPTTRPSGIGNAWRSPEPWSCPAARRASSSRPAARPSSAASTNCSPASARSRRRSCARSRSSAMPSPPSSPSLSALVFAYGKWVQGMDFVELFQAVVGIAVSVIPEGLPALITITLAIGVQRMAQRNAIIRRLPAVETLGSVSRICSDKTGTLTLMEMMVVSAVTAESAYQGHRRRLCAGGRGQEGRKARGQGPGARADGARLHALQRRGAVRRRKASGRWKAIRPRGRSIRSRPSSGLDRQAEQAAYPADRRHPVRIGAQVHGDAAQGRRRQAVPARQGRARSDPRALRPAADRGRTAGADRSRRIS